MRGHSGKLYNGVVSEFKSFFASHAHGERQRDRQRATVDLKAFPYRREGHQPAAFSECKSPFDESMAFPTGGFFVNETKRLANSDLPAQLPVLCDSAGPSELPLTPEQTDG